MGVLGTVAEAAGPRLSDAELVERVRAGDDAAFEQLFRRYYPRIRAYVQSRVRDLGRAEDVTQDSFLSALRRLRVTDSPIAFKPWLYEIARNAAIDSYRRASRAEELPVHDEGRLRQSDQRRLVAARAPDTELFTRQRFDHLRAAFDELPVTHHRALVMREFEGRSYREIGERLELTRPAVESTLFRARRRLAREYEELADGRRCESARAIMALMAEGVDAPASERRRFARHAFRCTACRRRARELGVEPLPRIAALRDRAAALLPLPWLMRRRAAGTAGEGASSASQAGGMLMGPGAQLGAAVAERAVALVAAAALAGAGGAALSGIGGIERPSRLGDERALPDAAERAREAITPGGHPLDPSPPLRGTRGRSLPPRESFRQSGRDREDAVPLQNKGGASAAQPGADGPVPDLPVVPLPKMASPDAAGPSSGSGAPAPGALSPPRGGQTPGGAAIVAPSRDPLLDGLREAAVRQVGSAIS